MRSVIYISSANGVLDDAALDALLEQCRKFNGEHEITGCLAYNGINFLQLIEGPDDAVELCLKRITSDFRHSGVVKVRDEAIGVREFPDWTMAGRLVPSDDGKSTRGLMRDLLVGVRQPTREIFEGFATLKST